jgi:hypothetical protein
MTGSIRVRRRVIVVAVLALVGAGYAALLPPGPIAAPAPGAEQVRGAIHVHTNRSDGAGTPADVAAAAARAGLQFVILTDHGDGTRRPDAPAYVDGVLVIDALEVSTTRGHVVALGLNEPAPYPLGGEGRDAVEDIQRLGGFTIAAHVGSTKPELQWTDPAAAIDGLEWINADSEWRDEGRWSLTRALFAYPVRGTGAITSLLDRPAAVMRRWDDLLRARPVVGVAAVDAHARIGLSEPYDARLALRIPSYEAMFRTISSALESATLSGNPAADAATVIDAIRRGAFFSALSGVAAPASLRFAASSGANRASSGGALPIEGEVTLEVDTNAPAGARVIVLKDGAELIKGSGPAIRQAVPAEPAVYRVEVHLPQAPGQPPVPWLVSNPIFVGRVPGAPAPADSPAATATLPIFADEPATSATAEQGGQSQAALDIVEAVPAGRQVLFRYAIGGRASESPYAAAAFSVAGLAGYSRLVFTARADQPMRLAVQLRAPGGSEGERWRRSIYLDEVARTIVVPFDEFRPVPGARSGPLPLADIDSLLFVVDSVHTPLGASGRVWLDDIRVAR